ncbi:MAG: TlpA disulfide reductase family protein [Bacteroidales bacterium]|nr:TlpA disulfide reductase family protein [Bacteroidales bacterium]
MNFKKNFATLLISFLVFSASAQEIKSVNIIGKVTGDTKGYQKIFYYSPSSPVAEAIIVEGTFNITLPFTETYTQLFYTEYEKGTNRSYRPFPLLIDGSGDIFIHLEISQGFFKSTITGPNTTVGFHSFLKQQNEISAKVSNETERSFGRGWVPQNDPLYPQINMFRDSLNKTYMSALVSSFVGENKDSFLGAYILNSAGKQLKITVLEELYNKLSPQIQKTPDGEKVAAYIRGVKGTNSGSLVKNFVLNDQDGNPISFDSFRGKYVWIDFWASWCAPCKQAFPHMREIYAKYKDKNFEILGISTDSKIEPWLKILPQINNPWPQVWDSKNIMGEFAVTAFPTSFLIDPTGKIILKEVGFIQNGELEKKLAELFGK